MFRQRALTALVGIPITLAAIYLGGWYLAGLVALVGVAGMRELGRITAAAALREPGAAASEGALTALPEAPLFVWARRVFVSVGYLFALLLPAIYTLDQGSRLAEVGIAAGAAVGLGIALGAGRRGTAVQVSALVTGVGALVTPALITYCVRLRGLGARSAPLWGHLPAGAAWLFLAFAACWAADTAAYAVGKKWGRRKLWPAVSPGKTVEGAIAALAASIVVTAFFGALARLPLGLGMGLGAILGVTGQIGDLAESKLKRWAGVKDSGAILPGHGGVLDRFDSLLANAPVAYYYLRSLAGV